MSEESSYNTESTWPVPSSERSWPTLLVALLVYLGLALYMLYPAWLAPLHGLPGDWRHPDMVANHWVYQWLPEQLLPGGSLFHNDAYFFPVGDSPWIAGNASDAFFYAPFALLLPWPASILLWVILVLLLNGLGGYTLARSVGARPLGSLIAGAFLVLNPYTVYELSCGRLAQQPLWAMALFLSVWIRLLAEPTLKRAALAGLLFSLTAFQYWYLGLWAAFFGAVLFLARPRWAALARFLPFALGITGPILAIFLLNWQEVPGIAVGSYPHPQALESGLPPIFPFWGGQGFRPGMTLPLILLALGALGFRRGSRFSKVLLAVAFMGWLLALGPRILHIDGTRSAIVGLHYVVYGGLDILRRFWWSYRHIVLILVALLPLAALGADRLFARVGRWRYGLAALLLLLMPLELALRGGYHAVAVSWWDKPEGYERLGKLPGGAILEVPLSPSLIRTEVAIAYERVHRKRIVSGHAIWVDHVRPRAWDAWVESHPFLTALASLELGRSNGRFSFPPQDVDALCAEGLRYLVLNPEYLMESASGLEKIYASLFTRLFGDPVLKVAGLRAWDLEKFRGTEDLEVSVFKPDKEDVSADGITTGRARVQVSVAFKPLERKLPPEIPPKDATEQALEGLPSMIRNRVLRDATSQPR